MNISKVEVSSIDRVNWTFRSEVVNVYTFESLEEVREAAWWMAAYNGGRRQEALGGSATSQFRKRLTAGTSNFDLYP